MSAKIITDLYADLNQKYYGEGITMDEYVGHSCFHIPHFYYKYYVYSYKSKGRTFMMNLY